MIRTVWGQCPFDEETVPGGGPFPMSTKHSKSLLRKNVWETADFGRIYWRCKTILMYIYMYIYILCIYMPIYNHMDVSQNGGTPKWMVYNGTSYWNWWFGGIPISGNLHIYIHIYIYILLFFRYANKLSRVPTTQCPWFLRNRVFFQLPHPPPRTAPLQEYEETKADGMGDRCLNYADSPGVWSLEWKIITYE